MGKKFGVNVVVGIPSFGMVSTYFAQSRAAQQMPLVSSAVDKYVLNKPIAEARNEIVEFALMQGANYIYWLDDDVVAPPDAFLKLYRHHKDIINGVYWSKGNPPLPLLFRGHLEGPYWDWKVGDLIEIDAAGNGLTLVKTDVYRKIGEPWYSTQYSSFKHVDYSGPNNTEDLYFYWKARNAGYKIWADTSVQALHYDKFNGVLYGMPPNAPQAIPAWEIKKPGTKLIADIGSGPVSPYMRDEGTVVSFDIREDMKPDVICDVRNLPVPDQTFDVVFSSHTLEHFSYQHVDTVLKEWSRVLKVGGELRLVVPNLKYSAQRILDDTMNATDYWVVFGEQDYPKNFHAAGFTPNSLYQLVTSLGIYDDIQIREGNYSGPPDPTSWNLQLKAVKKVHPRVANITPDHIEAPPQMNVIIPVRVYDNPNERQMDDAEKIADKMKWYNPELSVIEETKQKIIEAAKKRQEINSSDIAAFSMEQLVAEAAVTSDKSPEEELLHPDFPIPSDSTHLAGVAPREAERKEDGLDSNI